MKFRSTLALAACSLVVVAGSLGCASRSYVDSQINALRGEMGESNDGLRSDVNSARSEASEAMRQAGEAASGLDSARELALGNVKYREVTRHRIYFAFDSSALDEAARSTLEEVASEVTANPRYLVHLYGFADPTGPDQYNLYLGQRRADAVKRFLLERTPRQLSRLATVSYGENPPRSEEPTMEKGDRQRQVLIVLLEKKPTGQSEAVAGR
jgi:peptidoglycan-associated lipoprotein